MPKALSGYVVSVKITVAAIVSTIAAALILLYVYYADTTLKEQLEFSAAVLGGAALVYAGYYAGASLHVSMRESRRDRAFAIIQDLNSIDMAKTRRFIETKFKDRQSVTPADLYDRIMDDLELLGAITVLLGCFEDASIAIQENHADEKILYKSLCFLVPWANRELKDYIAEERNRGKGNDFYCEVQKLAAAWESGRYLSTNKEIEESSRLLKT